MTSKKLLVLTMIFTVSGWVAICENVSDGANVEVPFAQRAVESMAIVKQRLESVGRELADNPFDRAREPDKYNGYQERFERQTFEETDQAIKKLIWNGFQRRMSLQSIIASTEGVLSWSEWPKDFGMTDTYSLPGVKDASLTDQEWSADKNTVVVFYCSYQHSSGTVVHFFQNSFRAIRKDRVRQCPSKYTVLEAADGGLRFADLTWSLAGTPVSPRGAPSFEFVSRLLGFLPMNEQSVPGIMIWWGPSGQVMNFGVTLYTWNEQYKVWEGAGLWTSERVLSFDYNADTTDLTYYQCYEPRPDGPNVLGCPSSVNLRAYYLENQQYIEAQRKKNVAIGSPLSPPKEKYREQAQRPTEPNAPAKEVD